MVELVDENFKASSKNMIKDFKKYTVLVKRWGISGEKRKQMKILESKIQYTKRKYKKW